MCFQEHDPLKCITAVVTQLFLQLIHYNFAIPLLTLLLLSIRIDANSKYLSIYHIFWLIRRFSGPTFSTLFSGVGLLGECSFGPKKTANKIGHKKRICLEPGNTGDQNVTVRHFTALSTILHFVVHIYTLHYHILPFARLL